MSGYYSICFEQNMRIKRSHSESLFLLDIIFDKDDKVELKICGKTLNVYTITFSMMDDDEFTCDCPDSRRCLQKKIFCKHRCFVYFKVGKIKDYSLFINHKLSAENKEILKNKLSNIHHVDYDVINDELICKYFEKTTISEKEIIEKPKIDEKPRNIDEDCIICFEQLNLRKITNCKICNNCVHSDCLDIWLKSKNNCIFCKSKFEIKNETINNYINLS
jgi:hypothetical protein